MAYARAQKWFLASPGASPITFSDRAVAKILNRDTPVHPGTSISRGVWEYWGEEPSYHHTGPISTMYALREAMRLVAEEGIEERWDRLRPVAGAIKAGVVAMGVPLAIEDGYRIPTLNPVRVPVGVADDRVIDQLMVEHGIEVMGGLVANGGKIFRVGCMGHSYRSLKRDTLHLRHRVHTRL